MPNQEATGLYAEFHLHPVLQNHVPPGETPKEGRPIYKDEIYIRIQIKGQKNQIRDRKMKEQDKVDFPDAWARWLNQNEELKSGVPITALPGIGPSMQLELKTIGIRTVEDMAALSDAGCTNIRGGYMFRERAKAYLAAAAIKPGDVRDQAGEQNEPAPPPADDPVDVDAMQSDPSVVPAPRSARVRKRA